MISVFLGIMVLSHGNTVHFVEGCMDRHQSVDMSFQILSAMHFAHEMDIVHGDLQPVHIGVGPGARGGCP